MYDIVRMCVPNSPPPGPYQRSQIYDTPPLFFKKRKVYECPDILFLAFEWPKFSDTHVYAHIFAQILVKPLLSHLHKAGFLSGGGYSDIFTHT